MTKSASSAGLPPTCALFVASIAVRIAVSVDEPAAVAGSAAVHTWINVVPSLLQPSASGVTACATPWTFINVARVFGASSVRATTSVGRSTPGAIPSATRSLTARAAGVLEPYALSSGDPSRMPRSGAAIARRTTTAATATRTRCRTTQLAIDPQRRLVGSVTRRRGHDSFGPIVCRMTGRSVVAVATLSSGINSPPRPMLRRNGRGTTISAASDTATVTPLNTTE